MGQPQTLGWIWPKDQRPGKPSHWPRRWRLRDILTNKGPDIYVGVIGKNKSSGLGTGSGTNWHRWTNDITNAGETDENDTPIPWARRGPGVRYDFRQRKYQFPDLATWSKVDYCTGARTRGLFSRPEVHFVPRRFWDKNGNEYPCHGWHDWQHGHHPDH
jgi:hypothetical protein